VAYALTRRIEVMPVVTAVIVLIFGGLTLVLHDETFIKLKPTIIYVLFGGTLAVGLAFGKSLLGIVFDSMFHLTDEGWRKPHASLFEKALRETGAAPNEAVFVGDSPLHDIGGAKAVGMWAVLTQQYVARPYEGFDPQPDAVITHVRELQAVIQGLGA